MKITKQQLRKIIKESFLPRMASTKGAPMPLQSLASPEFAAAIKGKKINEVASGDNAEDLKDEVSAMRDDIQEIRDFCERGNMDFSGDSQTRVSVVMDQVLDLMEEAITILNEELAAEEE